MSVNVQQISLYQHVSIRTTRFFISTCQYTHNKFLYINMSVYVKQFHYT